MRSPALALLMTIALSANGDAQSPAASPATTHLEGLLAAMGGRDAWAGIAGMRVLATHHDAALPTPFENSIVNDFGRPAVRIDARGPGYQRAQAISAAGGWRFDGQAVTALTAERLRDEQRWWESNVYRTLARLARGDTSLRVEWIAPDRLAVFKDDGTRLNWFRLNLRDEPIAFGTWDSETGTIFGPLVGGPGGIRHPRWGASPDGRWRYEIERLVTLTGQVTVDVEPPAAR